MTDNDRPSPGATNRPSGATDDPPSADYSGAVSPRQLAGGFAIVAAILVLLVRNRRRRSAKRDAD